MQKRIFAVMAILIFAMAACGLPEPTATPEGASGADAVFTAAAQTVEAQLTGIALETSAVPLSTDTPSVPPTETATALPPTNTATPQPTNTTLPCNQASFVADVTIPDGTIFTPGTAFTKTWRLKNVGTCTWGAGYQLVFDRGDQMGGPAVQNLPAEIAPGGTVDVSVMLTAPTTAGAYRGYWRLRDASGVLFGVEAGAFWVDIKSGTPPSTTPAFFAVTSVNVSATGTCGSFTITAAITVNGPGTVTYRWVRSDGATDTESHPALNFTAAGSQSVSTTWATSASGSKWMDIYIDAPNHQQFGRATFSCP